ncbi:MAG: hypothetical protein QM708_08180 [Propioniciclava sp.]|uniref:hypothetical protein n=1 Tax=Propioniciclava sp. TaxID=2038686 RepID=UPI0039E5FE3B
MSFVHRTVGLLAEVSCRLQSVPAERDERGLSQSTEQAILVVATLGIATVIVGAVVGYINGQIAQIPRP